MAILLASCSGYLSALVATITGEYAINHGIELWDENVQHARRKCSEMGLKRMHFVQGDCFNIDVEHSMQYDRVYIGGGAEADARFLFKLCKPGGIVVGPFQMDELGSQSLRKARRVGATEFAVQDVLPVTFAPLVQGASCDGTNRRMVLRATSWTPHAHTAFPPRFKAGVTTLLMAHKRCGLISSLPKEVWFRIFSQLDRDWLSEPRIGQLCGWCQSSDTSASCGRCKMVRYCGKSCQRAHWKEHKKTCVAISSTGSMSPRSQPTSPESLATPRLSAVTPPQHGMVGPALSPFMQPAAAFNPMFHSGDFDDFDLNDEAEDSSEGADDHGT